VRVPVVIPLENEPEVAVTVLSVNAGVDKDAIEALVTANCPVLILVVASKVPVVIPVEATAVDTFNVPVLKVVDTTLVIVLLVQLIDPELMLVAVKVPVVTFANLAVPFTSNLKAGAVVFIPIFPAVVIILPSVLLLPIAENDVVDNTTPAETFVFTMFVDVIFTVVSVPPTIKFPDKLKLAPV
jgi:hypothetical protein